MEAIGDGLGWLLLGFSWVTVGMLAWRAMRVVRRRRTRDTRGLRCECGDDSRRAIRASAVDLEACGGKVNPGMGAGDRPRRTHRNVLKFADGRGGALQQQRQRAYPLSRLRAIDEDEEEVELYMPWALEDRDEDRMILNPAEQFVKADHLLTQRKPSNADRTELIRPEMMSWMYERDERDRYKLKQGQVRWDYKEVDFSGDLLGDILPDMSNGKVDQKELAAVQPMLDTFGDALEPLEAHNGIYRFLYHGSMKRLIGQQCWAEKMAKETHPDPDSVSITFVTPRKRDPLGRRPL